MDEKTKELIRAAKQQGYTDFIQDKATGAIQALATHSSGSISMLI